MTTPFSSPHSVEELRPVKLVQTVRQVKSQLRERGLLGFYDGEPLAADFQVKAEKFLGKLRGNSTYAGRPRELMMLGPLCSWLHEKNMTPELQMVKEKVCSGQLRPPLTSWWTLLSLFYDEPEIQRRLRTVSRSWNPKTRQRLETKLQGCKLDDLSQVPDKMALSVFISGTTLNHVNEHLGLVVASPLYLAVWARLLSPAAARWTAAHSISELEKYLQLHHHHDPVGRIGRQLLEPLHRAGLGVSELSANGQFEKLIQLLVSHLPKSESSSPWVLLGKEARELIRWWKTQRDMEQFFLGWHALPDRMNFWKRYVRHIQQIIPFKKAAALAMFVNGYWYVEFGNINNACYRYSAAQWKQLNAYPSRVYRPGQLKKKYPGGSMSHTFGWTDPHNFPRWIGVKPEWI